jgi:hypothetical protein
LALRPFSPTLVHQSATGSYARMCARGRLIAPRLESRLELRQSSSRIQEMTRI